MAPIDHITDHGDRAVARMTEFLRSGNTMQKLVRVKAERWQEIEEVFQDILAIRNIDTAAGVQLDRIGRIVGQPRGGRDDATYRIWIRARMRLNKSSGTPEDILAVFAAVTQGSTKLVLEESFPAGLVLTMTIGSECIVDPTELAALLREAKVAGVDAQLVAATSSDPASFACDPNGAGWGDSTNPATGGTLATVIQ